MPPKGKQSRKQSSSGSDSDSGPDDRTPAKKSKPEKPKAASPKSEENEDRWEIAKNRFVSVTEFKGKWYVSIREFYMDGSGDLKPSKKGIMLNMEQWKKFRAAVPKIEESIERNGC